jgi:hypothetical protein
VPFPITRTIGVLLSALLIAGCAGRQISGCTKLAGAGWTPIAAPANAANLLALENLPSQDVTWLADGSGRTMACLYAASLTDPSCGGSTAYVFEQKGGRWQLRDMLVDQCND